MSGAPSHTALVERVAPGLLFSSEHTLQLSITEIPYSKKIGGKKTLANLANSVQFVKVFFHQLF